MGKKKYPNDKDQVELLEEEIRKLKSINRHLLKRLKKVDRKFDPKVLDDEMPDDNICPECSRGTLIQVDLGVRTFKRCNICDFRSKTTKS